MLINHLQVTTPDLPPCGPYLCEYLTAANGVFVRAKRPGLEALLPVCLNFTLAIRGLVSLTPYIRLEAGPIPEPVMAWAQDAMAQAAPLELLTWVNWADGYHVSVPEQTTTTSRCKPLDPLNSLGQTALLDFHSHGLEQPFFSSLDNRDERQGFRLFAVAGGFPTPTILVRVGIYGHFWQIPPEWVMELPKGLAPVYEGGLPCLD
jgi:PRTRC genetic system protein A